MNRWLIAFLLFPLLLPGGQSLTKVTSTASITAADVPDNLPVRLEFHLHNWTPPTTQQTIAWLDFFDMQIIGSTPNTLRIELRRGGNGGPPSSVCFISMAGRSNALVRVQSNQNSSRFECEIWNVDGTGYAFTSAPLVVGGTSTFGNGSLPVYTAGQYALGFMRGFTANIALGSRPPVTAETGTYFDWKFEGNGSDSSGNGRTINLSGQSFQTTPQAIVALPKTLEQKFWMPFRPLRAGFANTLDGSGSYSMADGSPTVECYWQQVSGPSKLTWTSRDTCTPTITGVLFGSYVLRLRVTNGSLTETRDIQVGAVAYDDNGVVIYPDERLYDLLGPVLVMGANPWEYAEYSETKHSENNWDEYEINGGGWNAPHWEESLNGLVRTGTVVRPAPVTEPTKLYGVGTNWMTQFCGGRPGPAASGSWSTMVVERDMPFTDRWIHTFLVTSCQSETEVTINSSSVPLETPKVWRTHFNGGMIVPGAGQIQGTVYFDPAVNARKIYGVGTNLQTLLCAGGTTPVNSNWFLVYGPTAVTERVISSCQSETEITVSADITQPAVASPGVPWAYNRTNAGLGWNANGSSFLNFYDAALAYWRKWYSSGWAKARDSAMWLTRSAMTMPRGPLRSLNMQSAAVLLEVEGDPYGLAERYYDDLRIAASFSQSIPGTVPRVLQEPREDAYGSQWRAIGARFNDDSTQRQTHRTQLEQWWTNRVQHSIRDDGYMRNMSFYSANHDINTFFADRVLTVANGSSAVALHSGASIPADYCGDPATFYSAGTVTIDKASNVLTGIGTDWTGQAGKQVLLRGTLNGLPHSQFSVVQAVNSPTSVTLAFPWFGDKNSVSSYRMMSATRSIFGVVPVNSTGDIQNFGIMEDDWHWCTVDSSTQITLDKPFTGDTSDGKIYRRFARGHPGILTVAFMNGLLAQAMFQIAKVPELNEAIAASYREAAQRYVQYIISTTIPRGPGTIPWWDNGAPFCRPREPGAFPTPCESSSWTGATNVGAMRSFGVEAVWALSSDYLAAPTPEKRAAYDAFYNALFSATGWEQPYGTDNTPATQTTDYQGGSEVLRTKGLGQAWGMGGGQTWPAARMGGPAQPMPRTVLVPFSLDGISSATALRVTTYFPSGKVESKTCTSSPCAITVDARQGGHWILKQYLGSNSELIAEEGRQFIRE
jgi:hypothetical protein